MTGARLTVDIEKRLGPFRLTVRFDAGTEIVVLFGPSGAGKTLTLNAIAGLLTPDAGEVVFDGRAFFRKHRPGPAANVPARKRGIGFVFQNYALFPHLTVAENVAFALWRRRDAQQRALALLERMRLAHLAARYPHEISGGQQQRVALARALAAEPRLLLLDEPFSAIDHAARERLQQDLRALHAELGLVVICVTHQLEDAFAIGHRLVVIRDGQVAQTGLVDDVFRQPASHQVAEIMGIRNLFRATVVDSTPQGLVLDWDGLRLEAPARPATPGAAVTAYIRPEDIRILYPDRPATRPVHHNQVNGRILEYRATATLRTLRVALPNGHEVEVRFAPHAYAPLTLAAGDPILLSLRREALVILQE